jgi:hypothetical protein
LPRPVSNADSCLIPQLRFLTPSLDQQRSFADWAGSSLRTPVNRVSQVSATTRIGFKYQFASDRSSAAPGCPTSPRQPPSSTCPTA